MRLSEWHDKVNFYKDEEWSTPNSVNRALETLMQLNDEIATELDAQEASVRAQMGAYESLIRVQQSSNQEPNRGLRMDYTALLAGRLSYATQLLRATVESPGDKSREAAKSFLNFVDKGGADEY